MFISIKVSCSEKLFRYKITPKKNWNLHRSPIQFRRLNSLHIDQLGKVLEKIGLTLIKEQFPDVTMYDYYAYFHPLINEGLLKKIDEHFQKLKENST